MLYGVPQVDRDDLSVNVFGMLPVIDFIKIILLYYMGFTAVYGEFWL